MKVVAQGSWHALIRFDDPVGAWGTHPTHRNLLDWHASGMSGMGLGHAFASASRFRKAATPASDTSTHFRSGAAPATYSSCQFHHLYGGVWG
jgi:hypothetical protein